MSIWEPWLKKTLHFSGCCWICESNSMRLYKRLVFIIYDLQTIGKTGSDLYKVSCFQRDAVSEKMCNMPCQYFDLLQSKGLDFEYSWSYASRFQSQKFGLMDSHVTLLLFESRSYGTLLSQVVEVDQVGVSKIPWPGWLPGQLGRPGFWPGYLLQNPAQYGLPSPIRCGQPPTASSWVGGVFLTEVPPATAKNGLILCAFWSLNILGCLYKWRTPLFIFSPTKLSPTSIRKYFKQL